MCVVGMAGEEKDGRNLYTHAHPAGHSALPDSAQVH